MKTLHTTNLAVVAPAWANTWLRQLAAPLGFRLLSHEETGPVVPDVLLFLVPTHPTLFDQQLREWKQRWPGCRFIGWTAAHHPDDMSVFRMLNAGVHALLQETADTDELRRACQDVLRGNLHLNCHVTQAMLHFLRRQQVLKQKEHDGVLSSRERKMVELRRDGKTAEEIADRLCLSRKTVDKLFCELYRRTGSRNFFELLKQYERREHQPWAPPGSTEPLPATNSLR
jgi:DNA-binding NarL/FixJ family response regulator